MTSTTVAIEAVDVILRDGSTLRLRPPGEADRKPLVEFFEGLLYLRFHGHPTVDERLVEDNRDSPGRPSLAEPASPPTKVRGYADAVPKKTTAQMIAEAKAAGIEVTISKAPPRTKGEIVPLPGVRPPTASS